MQIRKKILFLGILITMSASLLAQDFHYTQYFHSPLGINPALAGAFNGSYRINGIYRDQYRGVGVPFGGFSLNVDAPIIRGFRKQDWVGVGLRMEQNKSGSIAQKLNLFGLGVAYHLALEPKQTSILTFGAQYATGGYSYDQLQIEDTGFGLLNEELSTTAATFNSSASGGGSGGANTTINGGSLNDLTVGVLYNLKNPKSGSDFKLGIAVEGILNPNRGKTRQDPKGIGINALASYEMVFTPRTSLTSGAYYYSLKQASALNINSIVNYKLKPEDKLTLHGGLGLRNVRAALVYLGVTMNGIRVGLGYDFDIGESTPATNNHKSIELGVGYIGKIYKKPKPKPIIYCPRL